MVYVKYFLALSNIALKIYPFARQLFSNDLYLLKMFTEMHTWLRKRRICFGSERHQHVWSVRTNRILRAVWQSSDQKDVWRVQPIFALPLLYDWLQQLCQSNVVAVGNNVRECSIPEPGQSYPALWYETNNFSKCCKNKIV